MKILVQAIDKGNPEKLLSGNEWLDLSEYEENNITQTLDAYAEEWGADWIISEWEETPDSSIENEYPNWQTVFEWQGLINDFGFDMARAVSEFNVLPSEARELYVGAYDNLESWAKSYLGNPIDGLDIPDGIKDCLTLDYKKWSELHQDSITIFEVGEKIYVFSN